MKDSSTIRRPSDPKPAETTPAASKQAPSANGRRRTLAAIAAAVGSLPVFGDRAAAKAAGDAVQMPAATGIEPALITDGRSGRQSSYDRSGGNADFFRIPAGATQELFQAEGPGVIRHIWATIAGPENHLKDIVLRMYWDGESSPSVETPVGDFFGLNLNEYFLYSSAVMTVASVKALNCYLPMPFRRSARITVTNEGMEPVGAYYSNIDYERLADVPPNAGYFHAQYRQAAPCKGWTNAWTGNGDPLIENKKNLDGAGNYVILEATGRGQYIGVTHGVFQNQDGWWGEGDDMMFIDGERLPSINGTGSEDYYNGAWDFGGKPFSYPYNGAPLIVNPERVGARWCLYRWQLHEPVRFTRSIRVTIEHGHANHRSDNFYTVAYWYQTEPHAPFPTLPDRRDRLPRLFAVGGPSEAPVPKE
jgi:hypothetical protein